MELLFIPAFYASVVFANRDLPFGITNPLSRWCMIIAISLVISAVGGYVLATAGIWFHLSIGGSL